MTRLLLSVVLASAMTSAVQAQFVLVKGHWDEPTDTSGEDIEIVPVLFRLELRQGANVYSKDVIQLSDSETVAHAFQAAQTPGFNPNAVFSTRRTWYDSGHQGILNPYEYYEVQGSSGWQLHAAGTVVADEEIYLGIYGPYWY